MFRGIEKLGVRDSAPWFWVIEEVSLFWDDSFPDVCSSSLTLLLHEEHTWTRWALPVPEHWSDSGKPLAKPHCLMFIVLFHWNPSCLILGRMGWRCYCPILLRQLSPGCHHPAAAHPARRSTLVSKLCSGAWIPFVHPNQCPAMLGQSLPSLLSWGCRTAKIGRLTGLARGEGKI